MEGVRWGTMGSPAPLGSGAVPGKTIAIIGAALDLGQGRRGVDMGPSAMRYADLEERLVSLGYAVQDLGNVQTAEPGGDRAARRAGALPARDPRRLRAGRSARARGRRSRLARRSCSAATTRSPSARSAASPRRTAAPAALSGSTRTATSTRPSTSPSGNVHGMPLAAALGLAGDGLRRATSWTLPAVDERRVAIVGGRSFDPAERELLRGARASASSR